MITKEQIPNWLTVSRGVLTGLILILFYTNVRDKYIIILILFILGAVSDFWDGKLARKFKCASEFGIVFDSMLDKVMILAIFMALIPYNLLPSWIFVLFLCRELIVDSTKSYFASRGKTISPKLSGKIKMAAQGALVVVCILRLINESGLLINLSWGLAMVGLATAYYSGMKYMSLWWKK